MMPSSPSVVPPSPPPPGRAPEVSPLAMPVFRQAGESYLGRHFRAVRLSRAQRPDLTAARQRPLAVYLNHSSWWDPLVCLQLACQLLPERHHFAPLEAAALGRHPLFASLGFFAVDLESARGARRFLDLATRVLEQADATLWITAGGALADPRARPVKPQPGLGHLAARLRRAVMVPLAIEYPFWSGHLPEALARFGEELPVEDAGMRARDWSQVLAARLEAAQDALAAEALARDEPSFEVMLDGGGGRAGAGGEADSGGATAWQRLRTWLRGRRRTPAGGLQSL